MCIEGTTVLELSVYYHDVLRYTIIANWDKVEELRSQGFYVQVKVILDPCLGAGPTPG